MYHTICSQFVSCITYSIHNQKTANKLLVTGTTQHNKVIVETTTANKTVDLSQKETFIQFCSQ